MPVIWTTKKKKQKEKRSSPSETTWLFLGANISLASRHRESSAASPDGASCCVRFSFASFFGFFCSTRVWTQGLHLEPLHQPFFGMTFFKIGSWQLFPRASNSDPPDLCLLSRWDYRRDHQRLALSGSLGRGRLQPVTLLAKYPVTGTLVTSLFPV
jgi:hypothetical protein